MAKKIKDETPETPSPSAIVRALVRMSEDGVNYAKGDTFTTTEERAAALGDSVELVPKS